MWGRYRLPNMQALCCHHADFRAALRASSCRYCSASHSVSCVGSSGVSTRTGALVRVLTPEEHTQLTDWDAEKYRQELARKAARKSA